MPDLVGRLHKRGLVLRVTHPTDLRSVVVRISAEGRATFDAVAARHRCWISRALADLYRDQCENLLALFDAARHGRRQRWRAAS